MANYKIFHKWFLGETVKFVIRNMDLPRQAFFAGYNEMGGANWSLDALGAYYMDADEAFQIKADLEAADDEPEVDPATKTYLVKTSIEDEPIVKLMTGKEVAKLYEDDQLSGIYGEIKVYDIDDDPRQISLLKLVEPILENQRWIEQEYRDYCENERYGD